MINSINNYFHKDKRIFAQGLCFNKLFAIFIIGSIFGSLYEQILTLVTVYMDTKEIVWVSRTAVIYGQFNMIYGMGAILLVYFLTKNKLSNWKVFLYGAIIGGGFEYLISFLQETFLQSTSWDYSDHFLTLNGRTSVPIMIIWGVLTLFLIKVVYPWVSKLIEKIPYNLGNIICKVLLIFLSIDILISWTALIRQTLRRNNLGPYTFIGEIYDKVYTDEFLEKPFPNMVNSK